MDGRMREIAEETGVWNKVYVVGNLVKVSDLENFARLIAQECASICESGNDTQMTCGGAADLIRQRFGIKR